MTSSTSIPDTFGTPETKDPLGDFPDFVAASEYEKNIAEADKARMEAKQIKLHMQSDRLALAGSKLHYEFTRAGDLDNFVYRFDDQFDEHSCDKAYEYLARWARMDITQPVEIQITSGGGDAWHGMALFDQILALRQQGLYVKITVRGIAASMAAILLQAADERVMGPSSFILVHKISGVAAGTLDSIEDTKVWMDICQNRINDIFAERTGQPIAKVRGWMNRKDSSFSPSAALEAGLIDAIG